NTVALVGLFKRLAEGAAPISVLGYAYALERCALAKTPEAIAAIEAIIPPGTMATRCLRVHSAVGTDAGHVRQSLDFIARLDGTDRAPTAGAASEAAEPMTGPDVYPGDDAFREILAAYRNCPRSAAGRSREARDKSPPGSEDPHEDPECTVCPACHTVQLRIG